MSGYAGILIGLLLFVVVAGILARKLTGPGGLPPAIAGLVGELGATAIFYAVAILLAIFAALYKAFNYLFLS